ncbi:MAG: carboxymuconolactone decarboxylase [Anaerocolumna sp.]|jgi:AhpD family alkylhydroperoxidase|nr:carboxymuconolactone decarboxylase [Anaerocolumna sp.]
MNNVNPFQVFLKESPEIASAYNNLLATIGTKGTLDNKTRQLIFIGIKASQGDTAAVTAHVPMAREAGATREEIRDSIVMTIAISGFQGISHCLVPALECFDNLN